MSCRRCSLCSIDFPFGVYVCQACGEKTDPIGNVDPGEDWEGDVARAKGIVPDVGAASTSADKVEDYRARELERLGLDEELARAAARLVDRDAGGYVVDLHEFERIRKTGASPMQALAILS